MKIVYIDVQNTHRKTLDYDRIIDRKRFFVYLKEKYKVDVIYYAVGYVSKYQRFYDELERIGYAMLFKKTIMLPNGEIKWNVDIDIAIRSIYDLWKHGLEKAYLVTNDGDYNTLIQTLIDEWVFGWLLAPDAKTASRLITQISWTIVDIQRIKHLIQKQKDSPKGESS